MPVPRAILLLKLIPPPLPVWVGEEDGADGDKVGEPLTESVLEALEPPISVVVGPTPAGEGGDTELLGISVSDPAAIIVVNWDSIPF
jgi:hypothetical protein